MSNPTGTNVEFTRYRITGIKAIETYCEDNPPCTCDCGVGTPAGPGNTQPIIGSCVQYTVVEVPASFIDRLYQYCTPNPEDCCPGSLNTDGQGQSGLATPEVVLGHKVQKTVLNLPPGSRILQTYCVFNPSNCCGGSGSGSAASVSVSIPPIPPTADCFIEMCKGELTTSHCSGLLMSREWKATFSGITPYSPPVCISDCTDFNGLAATLSQDANLGISSCEWYGLLPIASCYDHRTVRFFYNGADRSFEDIPNNSWVLQILNLIGQADLTYAIPDSAFDCVDCVTFTANDIVFRATPQRCDWSHATISVCPVFQCGVGSGSGSGSESGSGSIGVSISGSVLGSVSGSGSGSGSSSVPCVVINCCPCVPIVLRATIAGNVDCPCASGTIVLNYDSVSGKWIGRGPMGSCGQELILTLTCNPGEGCDKFILSVAFSSCFGTLEYPQSSCNCSPFLYRTEVTGLALICGCTGTDGRFTVTITE